MRVGINARRSAAHVLCVYTFIYLTYMHDKLIWLCVFLSMKSDIRCSVVGVLFNYKVAELARRNYSLSVRCESTGVRNLYNTHMHSVTQQTRTHSILLFVYGACWMRRMYSSQRQQANVGEPFHMAAGMRFLGIIVTVACVTNGGNVISRLQYFSVM